MTLSRRAMLKEAATAALALTPGCRGCRSSTAQVVVYTTVDQVFSEPVFRAFEAQSGLQVRALYDMEEAKSTGVLHRLLAEADNPQADVFWSGDPVRPFQLVKRGLVEPYLSPQAAGLPTDARAADGTWTGFAARARVLLVNRARVPPAEAPRSIRDLTSARWRGSIGIANPLYGTTTMHVGALFSVWGEPLTRSFLDALRANAARVAASNGEVKRLVVSGEVAFGLTDSDDAYEALNETGANVEVVYPDQDDLGTLVMPTSVVMLRRAAHADGARLLIDYLLSAAVEQRMAERAAHMPLRPGVKVPAHVRRVNELRSMHVDYGRVSAQIDAHQAWLREWVGL